MSEPRWIIHLPTTLTCRDAAAELATALARSLGHLDAVDFGETTLSEEDAQHVRYRLWCDVRLSDGERCRLRDGHGGLCGATELR
ncbi:MULTISPECIES: hypothetical protein [unclassified Micromonospora]|uniref:hypothetical protein n=1 Tax=unclassified Micromonospora TaxID=2617518 RepID=UPI0033CCBA1C